MCGTMTFDLILSTFQDGLLFYIGVSNFRDKINKTNVSFVVKQLNKRTQNAIGGILQ